MVYSQHQKQDAKNSKVEVTHMLMKLLYHICPSQVEACMKIQNCLTTATRAALSSFLCHVHSHPPLPALVLANSFFHITRNEASQATGSSSSCAVQTAVSQPSALLCSPLTSMLACQQHHSAGPSDQLSPEEGGGRKKRRLL